MTDRAPWEDRVNPARMALEQAVELAAQGIPVFPCLANKKPACRHGFKQATKDVAHVGHLWRECPGVRIGVPTGEASGLFCLDVDTARHPEAVQWQERLAPHLPQTRLHRTESGGWHYLFQHKDGLRCTTSKIERGIDTRGDGGYIIWWPAHVVSIEHRFMPVAPVPGWLVEALNPNPIHVPSYYAAPQRFADAPRRLEGILTKVAEAREGERNAITFWGACRIGEMVLTGELDGGDGARAFAALREAAQRTGLHPSEIRRTIESALR